MRTQAMPATCGRFGAPASNPRSTRPGPPPAPLRRSGGDGRPAAAHAADSRFPHDARHPAAADPGRIPALRRRPGARLAAPVHGHEGTGMGLEDAAGRRPADRPDPETVPEPVDASDHQRRAGPSLAAKRSRRRRQNPVHAPQSRDLGPRTLQLRHRVPGRLPGLRRDPGSPATCSTALVSDEHEPRDSVNSPTAFALNSGAHPAPFAMAPSSPIEPGETRNKKQFISDGRARRVHGRPPMDCAHEGDPTRAPAESFGLTPVVPPKRNRTAPWDCDREAHKGRNMVERVFNRMKSATARPPPATTGSTRPSSPTSGSSSSPPT